ALNPGDPFRKATDSSGFISKLFGLMPHPNAFNDPNTDGLNTATIRWVRRTIAGSAGGTGENVDAYRRKQFNIKIDHHINANNRFSATWIHESRYSDNNLVTPWPTGWSGEITEDPRVITAQLTSTLKPTLLNEFKWGHRVSTLGWIPAFHSSHYAQQASNFLPQINGYPVIFTPAITALNPIAGGSFPLGNQSPLNTYTDTLSWTKGKH